MKNKKRRNEQIYDDEGRRREERIRNDVEKSWNFILKSHRFIRKSRLRFNSVEKGSQISDPYKKNENEEFLSLFIFRYGMKSGKCLLYAKFFHSHKSFNRLWRWITQQWCSTTLSKCFNELPVWLRLSITRRAIIQFKRNENFYIFLLYLRFLRCFYHSFQWFNLLCVLEISQQHKTIVLYKWN